MNKPTLVQSYNKALFSNKERWTIRTDDMGKSYVYFKVKAASLWLHMYDSIYMAFWRKQKYRDDEKISGCQGFVGRESWMDEV